MVAVNFGVGVALKSECLSILSQVLCTGMNRCFSSRMTAFFSEPENGCTASEILFFALMKGCTTLLTGALSNRSCLAHFSGISPTSLGMPCT